MSSFYVVHTGYATARCSAKIVKVQEGNGLVLLKGCRCAGAASTSALCTVMLCRSTVHCHTAELQNVIFLHGAKPSSQILPEEKRINRDNFGTKIDKGVTFGEQMLIILLNYESLDRHFT